MLCCMSSSRLNFTINNSYCTTKHLSGKKNNTINIVLKFFPLEVCPRKKNETKHRRDGTSGNSFVFMNKNKLYIKNK